MERITARMKGGTRRDTPYGSSITSAHEALANQLQQRRHQSAACIVDTLLCFQQACTTGRWLGVDSTDPFPESRFLLLPWFLPVVMCVSIKVPSA